LCVDVALLGGVIFFWAPQAAEAIFLFFAGRSGPRARHEESVARRRDSTGSGGGGWIRADRARGFIGPLDRRHGAAGVNPTDGPLAITEAASRKNPSAAVREDKRKGERWSADGWEPLKTRSRGKNICCPRGVVVSVSSPRVWKTLSTPRSKVCRFASRGEGARFCGGRLPCTRFAQDSSCWSCCAHFWLQDVQRRSRAGWRGNARLAPVARAAGGAQA